ncbi:unnamed protein product, partial [Heterosigma akashiwo]
MIQNGPGPINDISNISEDIEDIAKRQDKEPRNARDTYPPEEGGKLTPEPLSPETLKGSMTPTERALELLLKLKKSGRISDNEFVDFSVTMSEAEPVSPTGSGSPRGSPVPEAHHRRSTGRTSPHADYAQHYQATSERKPQVPFDDIVDFLRDLNNPGEEEHESHLYRQYPSACTLDTEAVSVNDFYRRQLSSEENILDIEGSFLKSFYIATEAENTYAGLRVSAPEHPNRVSRAPLDIVVCLDKSGSMRGHKLEMCKATLDFLLSQLSSTDRFALCTFDSRVEARPLAYMTGEGKMMAARALHDVEAGRHTNLGGALFKALEVLREAQAPLVRANKSTPRPPRGAQPAAAHG